MNIENFKASIQEDAPPVNISAALQALWWDAKGDWKRAHELAQSQKDQIGAWVHAYLHRVEGDHSNAGFWYSRAERIHSKGALDEEWHEIAGDLIKRGES